MPNSYTFHRAALTSSYFAGWLAMASATSMGQVNSTATRELAASIATVKSMPVSQPGENGVLAAEFIYQLDGRPTPECHASTIAETSDGLIAAWFGGKHENHPDVGIWLSRHDGQSWSVPRQIVDGSEGEDQDYACWNPVLFQPRSGPLMLFYKVGINPELWWGAVVTSSDGGRTWSTPRRLGTSERLFAANQNLIGPVKNKPIELEDGTILCPSSTENEGWRVHFELTRDQGQSWEVIGPLQAGEKLDAIQPSILTYADGRLQILCRTRQGVVGTSWSKDNGRSWGPMESTSLPNPNSGTDAVTLADGRQLLVYNHSQRGEQNGRQILNVALSRDGTQWQTVLTLEQEGHPAGYSYPAVIQSSDGRVHITYTWRRQTIKHVILDPAQL
jgi:predicted neuraminidase